MPTKLYDQQKAYRDRRTKRGLCLACPCKRKRGKTLCAACIVVYGKRSKAAVEKLKKKKLCTQHCGQPARPGRLMCQSCADLSAFRYRSENRRFNSGNLPRSKAWQKAAAHLGIKI